MSTAPSRIEVRSGNGAETETPRFVEGGFVECEFAVAVRGDDAAKAECLKRIPMQGHEVGRGGRKDGPVFDEDHGVFETGSRPQSDRARVGRGGQDGGLVLAEVARPHVVAQVAQFLSACTGGFG